MSSTMPSVQANVINNVIIASKYHFFQDVNHDLENFPGYFAPQAPDMYQVTISINYHKITTNN